MKDFTETRVTIANASNKVKSFVPYAQSFLYKLQPQTAIEFPANSVQSIYYTKQVANGLAAQALGKNDIRIVAGTLDGSAFTPSTTYMYVGGKIIGDVPYSDTTGFSITLKITNPRITLADLPSGVICKVTDIHNEGGYSEYTKDDFESDGSFVCTTKLEVLELEILINWGDGFETYSVDCSGANLVSVQPTPPTPEGLTAFEVGDEIVSSSSKLKVDKTQDVDAIIAVLPYSDGVVALLDIGDTQSALSAINFGTLYLLSVADGSQTGKIIYANEDNSEMGITAGWQNLDANDETTFGTSGTVSAINGSGWNGILIGKAN